MKSRVTVSVVALATALLVSTTALAASHTGTVSLYHLNSNVAGRGVCVQTSPAMSNTWACLWRGNPLYDEISQLLLKAYIDDRRCTIRWSTTDSHGWNLIELVECF